MGPSEGTAGEAASSAVLCVCAGGCTGGVSLVLHGAVGGGVGRAGLTSHFPAVLGIPGLFQIGFLTLFHFSDYAEINCDKGLLFLHCLSLKEHMKKPKSLSNACSPIDVSVPFGVRTMLCAAQALEVSL